MECCYSRCGYGDAASDVTRDVGLGVQLAKAFAVVDAQVVCTLFDIANLNDDPDIQSIALEALGEPLGANLHQ